MEKYEFHSVLPPEQVFARLEELAHWERFRSGRFHFSHTRKGNCFILRWERRRVRGGGIPFRGQVISEAGGSLITGGFRLSAREIFIREIVWFILLYVIPRCSWKETPSTAAGLAAIMLVACNVFLLLIEKFCNGKYRQAELDFIQKNLLN